MGAKRTKRNDYKAGPVHPGLKDKGKVMALAAPSLGSRREGGFNASPTKIPSEGDTMPRCQGRGCVNIGGLF
jgi:hypothetical protein